MLLNMNSLYSFTTKKKLFILFLTSLLLFSGYAVASDAVLDCMIVKNENKIIIQEGKNCNTLYSPNSTFKIPLAVIGFESGELVGRHTPIWMSRKPITFLKSFHQGEHSPSSWMRFSVVWYSQILTSKIGIEKLRLYLDKINYGNNDLSGDATKNNGLTESWLSSSLKITPLQQIEFIENLANDKLQFSKESQIKTKDLIKLFEESYFSNGWTIYGKTGTSDFDKINFKEGYFVGFGEKNGKIVSFAVHISGEFGDKKVNAGGMKAKQILINKMTNEGIFN